MIFSAESFDNETGLFDLSTSMVYSCSMPQPFDELALWRKHLLVPALYKSCCPKNSRQNFNKLYNAGIC